MRILEATSPMLTGDDVKHAQSVLKGDNTRKHNYGPGDVDGQYGAVTAAATRRAQYWYGFQKSNVTGKYGPVLDSLMTGKSKMSTPQNIRRALRLRALKTKPLREKAFDYAMSQVGTLESPSGSNRVKYSDWYGMVGPWCAMFVSYCITHAGGSFHYAYCPYIVADATASRNGLQLTGEPEHGDLALYDWDGDGAADHVGFFEAWIDSTTFSSVEGNTSADTDPSGSQSNGGGVYHRHNRTRSQVRAFVRYGA